MKIHKPITSSVAPRRLKATKGTKRRPKILVVFGTRPEAIKMAPVLEQLRLRAKACETRVCVTGQHREMLEQVLTLFKIKPDWDLKLMQPGQNLFGLTARLFEALKPVMDEFHPDLVLVQGDTTTAMAGALAGFYHRAKIGHVEAGLRTGDKHAPFPEEINRRIAGVVADYHFAPTTQSRDNLLAEAVLPETVFVTGNTVIDALLSVSKRIESNAALRRGLEKRFSFLESNRRLILVTGHRRENFGQGFEEVCQALSEIVERHPNVEIVYPVHLNPNVREPVQRLLDNNPQIHLIEPLEYLPLVYVLGRCHFVITDSGGLQEEAPSLGKPVLVMRETTERPEAVTAGTVKLVGTNRQKILFEASALLDDASAYQAMSFAHNPYGDGKAAERIADILLRKLLA